MGRVSVTVMRCLVAYYQVSVHSTYAPIGLVNCCTRSITVQISSRSFGTIHCCACRRCSSSSGKYQSYPSSRHCPCRSDCPPSSLRYCQIGTRPEPLYQWWEYSSRIFSNSASESYRVQSNCDGFRQEWRLCEISWGRRSKYSGGLWIWYILNGLQFIDYTKEPPYKTLERDPPTPKFHVILEAVGNIDLPLYTHSEAYLAPGGIFVSVVPQPSGIGEVPSLGRYIWGALLRPRWLGGTKRKWRCVGGQTRVKSSSRLIFISSALCLWRINVKICSTLRI